MDREQLIILRTEPEDRARATPHLLLKRLNKKQSVIENCRVTRGIVQDKLLFYQVIT